jgi:predicted anti-sigma-YlaC factor YlaD
MKHDKETCEQVFALLSEYLDAELDLKTCEDIEKHLAGCPPCIEFLNSLRRSVRLCRECEPSVTPPPMTPAERDHLRAAYQKAIARK